MKEIHTPLGPCMALTVPVLSTVHITEGDRATLQVNRHIATPINAIPQFMVPTLSPWLRHILHELREAGFEYVRFDSEAEPTPGLPNLQDL